MLQTKRGREIKAHVLFQSLFREIVATVRQYRKILYSRAGHRWQYRVIEKDGRDL